MLRVYRELDFTLRTLTPGQSVVLAFDGPGPNAKLITQRKRRAKKALTDKYKISGLNITPVSLRSMWSSKWGMGLAWGTWWVCKCGVEGVEKCVPSCSRLRRVC